MITTGVPPNTRVVIDGKMYHENHGKLVIETVLERLENWNFHGEPVEDMLISTSHPRFTVSNT